MKSINVKQIIFLILLMYLQSFYLFSQPFKNIIGPSPAAAAFSKYEDIPIDNYTGIPKIEIPLYNIQNQDIQVPITLSYHASGFRVDEEAGRAGLGWVVNAGGIINRSVNGIDDFMPTRGYLNNSLPGFYGNTVTPALQSSSRNLLYSETAEPYIVDVMGQSINMGPYLPSRQDPEGTSFDMEPDVFNYNFNGISGKFSITKDKEIIKQNQDGIKIKLLNNDGTSWQITTTNGVKYIFDKYERCRFQSSSGAFSDYITSWYLTKVISPSGGEVVFNYSSEENFSIKAYNSVDEKYILEVVLIAGSNELAPHPGSKTTSYPPIKTYNPVFLTSIDFPLGKISFEYNDRIDVAGDKRLSKININNLSLPSASFSYELVQDYFTAQSSGYTIPDPETNMDQNLFNKRLKLKSLVKKNATNTANEVHYFYYTNMDLPTKKSLARDHWGFYNGAISNTTLLPSENYPSYIVQGQVVSYPSGANRSASDIYSRSSMLNEIVYPTGGKTSFEYEANDYDIANSVNNNSSTPPTELVTETKTFMTRRGTDDTFNVFLPATFSNSRIKFRINSQNGQTTAWPYPYPEDAFFEIYSPQDLTTPIVRSLLGSEDFWIRDNPDLPNEHRYHRDDQFLLAAGNYVIKTHVANNVVFLNYIDFSFTYSYYKDNSINHRIGIGGGLRISKIINYDPIAEQSTTRNFNYHYNFDYDNDGTAEECSYGKRLTSLRYSSFEQLSMTGSDGSGNGIIALCMLHNLFSQSKIPNDQTIVGYDKVKSWVGDIKKNGYTEYEYINLPSTELVYTDNLSHTFDLRPPGLNNLNNLSNGSLLAQTDYQYKTADNSFKKTKEILDIYGATQISTHLGLRLVSSISENYAAENGKGIYFLQYPAFQTKWNKLISKTTNLYSDNMSTSVKTEYEYEVNEPKHYLPIKATTNNSNGKKITDINIYPTDYADGNTSIDNMKIANIISPIEQIRYLEQGNAKNVVSGNIFSYKSGGKGLMDKEYKLDVQKPISISEFKFSNRSIGILPTEGLPTVFSSDGNYKLNLLFNNYDASGNILERQKVEDIKEVYLWGYGSQYPVAKVIGSDYNTVKSFVTQSILDDPATTDITMRVELNKIRIGLAGTKAQVFTFTYKPLVGITSETDQAGRIIYYEYDTFDRLSVIKDDIGNIVKKICYNYAGQIIDCATGISLNTNPQWVATGNTRCAKDANNKNTGYQEKEEKDTNINSPTYNQTRWVNNGQNATTCPLPPLVSMIGTTSFSYSTPNGSGNIYAPAGYRVTVTITAGGASGSNYTLNSSISGAAVTGPTSVTNGTFTYTFTMPSSGSVSWSANFSGPNHYGNGNIKVQ